MSWKSEVIADMSGKWCGNGLRFATREEADAYVKDLAWRWTSVRESRVVETDEPVTYAWDWNQSKAKPLEKTDAPAT